MLNMVLIKLLGDDFMGLLNRFRKNKEQQNTQKMQILKIFMILQD